MVQLESDKQVVGPRHPPLLPDCFFSFHLHMFVCMQVVLPQSNQQGKEGFQNQKVNLMVNLERIQMELEIT